jgi:hypothetical protein
MANFLICTDEIPVENQILNLKIMKQTLPVPNVLLDCVIFFFIILAQLELFVAFSKVNNQLGKF